MAAINPPPLRLRSGESPEMTHTLKQIQNSIYQMWNLFGAGTGVVSVPFGGTGAQTVADSQANLGLRPGVDIQVHSASLSNLSGLTTAANQMVYLTASDTWAATDTTAFGRGLLNSAGV